MIMKKAVILLSGGLDSTTCLAIAKQEGYELHALSFNYGQRHEFEIDAAKNVANSIGVKNQINLNTPLIQLTKAEIIKTGLALGVNYGITHSCYDPVDKGNPCGACDACQIRLKGFLDAGLSDPLVYNK